MCVSTHSAYVELLLCCFPPNLLGRAEMHFGANDHAEYRRSLEGAVPNALHGGIPECVHDHRPSQFQNSSRTFPHSYVFCDCVADIGNYVEN